MKKKVLPLIATMCILFTGCNENDSSKKTIKIPYPTTTQSQNSSSGQDNSITEENSTSSIAEISSEVSSTPEEFKPESSQEVSTNATTDVVSESTVTESNPETSSKQEELSSTSSQGTTPSTPTAIPEQTTDSVGNSSVTPEQTTSPTENSEPSSETSTSKPNNNIQTVTFYIENQIDPNVIDSIRLVSGYIDHPSFKNLLNGNTSTVPEGECTLSIKLKEGYEYKTNHGRYFVSQNTNNFEFVQLDNITTHLYVDKNCQYKTLVISGETGIDYGQNNELTEDELYRWYPEYKGKEFSYEIPKGISFKDHSYSLTKNGKPLNLNDKLKVGDKLRITLHSYDDNIFFSLVTFQNSYLTYNDFGELSTEYTITANDIPYRYDRKPEDCVISLSTWESFTDFAQWKDAVNLTTYNETGGNFTVYKVTLDKNNNETITKVDGTTRLVPGNRLKLEPNPVNGWQFDGWEVSGGIITK